MQRVLLGLMVAGLLGCSDPLSPEALAGDWRQETFVPGVSFTMTLVADGSALTGVGQDCGEAMACKPFTVSGTVEKDGEVRLAFAYANNVVPHFVGRLSFNALSGSMSDGMPSLPPGPVLHPVVFRRANFIRAL